MTNIHHSYSLQDLTSDLEKLHEVGIFEPQYKLQLESIIENLKSDKFSRSPMKILKLISDLIIIYNDGEKGLIQQAWIMQKIVLQKRYLKSSCSIYTNLLWNHEKLKDTKLWVSLKDFRNRILEIYSDSAAIA